MNTDRDSHFDPSDSHGQTPPDPNEGRAVGPVPGHGLLEPDFAAWGIPIARPISGYSAARQGEVADPLLLRSTGRASALGDIVLAALLMLGLETALGLLLIAWSGSGDSTPPDTSVAGRTPAETGFEGDMPHGDIGLEQTLSGDAQQELLVPGLVLRTVCVLVVVFLIIRRRRQSLASVGVKSKGWLPDIGIGLAGLVVSYGIISMIALLVWVIWPDLSKQLQENARQLQEIIPVLSPVAYLGISVLIGVYEELFFRGFLMTRLRRASGSWFVAVLLSTIVFTALHAFEQTIGALIIVATLSVIFSLLTIWRRSILPAIVTHALFNFSQFLLL